MNIEKTKEILSFYTKKASYSTMKFHELIFDDEVNFSKNINVKKLNSALLHLNQGLTYINLANLHYLQYCETGECTEFEDTVYKFNVLNNEFLTSYSTNHSLQWTDIEYNAFKESCDDFLSICTQ